jgi:cytochrome c oxidase subunit 2
MEGIIDLHHDIMFFLVIVVVFVFRMLSKNIQLFNNNKTRYKQITHHTALEVV